MIGVGALSAAPASANHSWGNYRGATTSWDRFLDVAIADWSASSVMNLVEESGREEKDCRAATGKVKSCNGNYGNNGWLGLATIRVNGSHITSGTAKMNDTYFSSPAYDDTARRHVMCQEIGHDFGLDHRQSASEPARLPAARDDLRARRLVDDDRRWSRRGRQCEAREYRADRPAGDLRRPTTDTGIR